MSENQSANPQNGAKAAVDVRNGIQSATFRWTARDQFASAAMQALVPTVPVNQLSDRIEEIAKNAYKLADAMLRNA